MVSEAFASAVVVGSRACSIDVLGSLVFDIEFSDRLQGYDTSVMVKPIYFHTEGPKQSPASPFKTR